jgi:pyruvate dehydrogenase E1 component
MSDDDIDRLRRGSHDPVKIYAAYRAAAQHKGQPTVILAQTKKGYGMGHWGQGKMGTHQQKKLDDDALREFRDRFAVPLSDEGVAQLRFLHPGADSAEIKYLHARRQALGGYLPARVSPSSKLKVPKLAGSERSQSTTMAFVQLLTQLMKDEAVGRRVVPIVADEARTFGMQTLFRQFGIYSSLGQLYEPEDQAELLYYREAKDGQILEEGITEAGALSSWLAAATAYSSHGTPMLPFYIYYSMFGFQRVGDLVWAAADSRARGFLVGGTAGRTTLAGEGLQHQDGSSHLAAATIPNCRAYDPCFAHELAAIVEDGARRMLEAEEDVFYYLTVANENYAHPAPPQGSAQGILRGMYRLREGAQLQLLGAGPILREVIAAAELLEKDWRISAGVWSITSFTELRRDGMQAERARRLGGKARSWVEECLAPTQGPVVAASDYVSAVADLIRPYVPRSYVALGTDGFGRSDTRAALRRFFEVDAKHIALAALAALDAGLAADALHRYGIDPVARPPWER